MREAIALLRFSGIAYMRPTKADNRVQLETSFLRLFSYQISIQNKAYYSK